MKKTKIKYYPSADDEMWNKEVSSIIGWLEGKGVDVGSGTRTISKDLLTVDIDPKHLPAVVASGDKLPFKDNSFDHLVSIHSLEHFRDAEATLREWARVLKPAGIAAVVMPDLRYVTPAYAIAVPNKKESSMYHHREWTKDEFVAWYSNMQGSPMIIKDWGVACPRWSFYVIFQKEIK